MTEKIKLVINPSIMQLPFNTLDYRYRDPSMYLYIQWAYLVLVQILKLKQVQWKKIHFRTRV